MITDLHGPFRLRNVENGTESCVLLKDSGVLETVENNIKIPQFPSEEKVSVCCEYVESKIKAFYKLKSQKNYTLLCEHTINEENASGCTHIGFGNELGEVTISNIRNKTIVFH
jgi:hypothetical protein